MELIYTEKCSLSYQHAQFILLTEQEASGSGKDIGTSKSGRGHRRVSESCADLGRFPEMWLFLPKGLSFPKHSVIKELP